MKISHKKVVEEHNQFAEEYDSWYEGSYNEYVREIEADILLRYLPKNKDLKILYRNLGMLIVKKDEKRISKLLKTGLYSSDFHKYTEINYRIGDIENLVKKFKFKLGYILGKDIFYQYFSKLKSEDVDKIFNNQKNKKYFMDLDRQLRQNRNFIPLAIEIIAVLKK